MKQFVTVFILIIALGCSSATRNGIDDGKIESGVRSAITNAVPATPVAIEVHVDKGIVTLSGRAASEEDRRKIADAANDVKGVRSVINNIQIE